MKYKAPNYLAQAGGTSGYNNNQGLAYNVMNYPTETFDVMSNFEMPSNQAYGNYSGVNNTGQPSFKSNISVGDIGGMDTGTGLLDSLGGASGLMNGAMTIMNGINMYKAWDMQESLLDMAKEQEARSAEKWGMTKEELGRIKRVRQNISGGYANGGNYAQQEAQNPSERPSKYPV